MKTLCIAIIAIVLLSILTSVLPPVLGTSGSAFFMKSNSTAKIYANFAFPILDNKTWTLRPQIFTSLSDPSSFAKDLNIDSAPNSFIANKSNVKVIFTITAKGDAKGVYSLFLYFCGLSPLVVGLNESEVNPALFNEFFTATYFCGSISKSTPDMSIIGYSNMISKIITIPPNGTNNVDLVNQLGQLPPSPLKQLEAGVKSSDIKCRENFLLITKRDDGSPACVTTYTAIMLAERGWTTSVQIHTP